MRPDLLGIDMKKSQMQLGETMAILLVFMVLVGLGFAFYMRVSKASFEKDLKAQEAELSIQKLQTITHLPELACSSEGVITDNCIDVYKASASAGPEGFFTKNRIYYQKILGYSSITLYQMSPSEGSPQVLYESKKGSNYNVVFLPVILHDPVENSDYYGLLEIATYTK
ncbi:hypothetical protein HY638_00275 [Candidatus Woesearchaeota archaeon]|nr:hypothetical protein [Candidatus Woesearchaeota archaeon]